MAGYGAVVSLQQTIERILQSSRISLDPPSAEIIRIICRDLKSFGKILERLDDISPRKSRKKVNALDGRIKEAVWRFEDVLESHLLHQILSHHFERDSDRVLLFSIDVLQNDVGSFIETVKDMKKEYLYELDNMPQVEEDEDVNASTLRSSSFGGMNTKMVGFSNVFEHMKSFIMDENVGNHFYILVGMPGSGKTTLAQNFFEDPAVLRWFDYRVWITFGRKYELNEIERHILDQLDPHINEIIPQARDDKISEILKGKLERKRCLIVLDNVWDAEAKDYFNTLMAVLEENAMIGILLTTNLDKVVQQSYVGILHYSHTMEPLNEDDSEDLLRMKVFGEEVEDFPPRLEKAAKKIAKNCKGLPLMIVTVADLLLKANKNDDLEFWNEVAENPYSIGRMMLHVAETLI